MKLSIVIPVYNEGAGVNVAYNEIGRVLRQEMPGWELELIFVDDGSRDGSFLHLAELAEQHPEVRVIKFASNRGSHMALRAGLRHASGDMAAYLPCDLQEPPAVIPRMVEALKGQTQIVWAVRQTRQDAWPSRALAWAFYALARRIVSPNIPPNGTGTFLLSRQALRAVSLFHEQNLSIDGILASAGFRAVYIPYDRAPRTFGQSKWTLARKLKHFADFFVAHSYVPIRLMSFLGISVAGLGFLLALIITINRLFFLRLLPGWASLIVVVLVLGGIQMVMTGIIGEYLWRTLDEARRRPEYLIETMLNAGPAAADEEDVHRSGKPA